MTEYTEHLNENSIEIKCIGHPKTNLQKLNPVESENPNIFEKGGALVLTQTYTGHIIFIFYPLTTEKSEPIRKEILTTNIIEPNKIDSVFITKILYKFMLLIRDTSLYGSETLTLYERCKVLLIFFMDKIQTQTYSVSNIDAK